MPRFRRHRPGFGSPKVPKFKAPKPTWKPKDLDKFYKKLVNASAAARVAALYEAIDWFDNVIPQLIAQQALTAAEEKQFAISVKVRSLGISSPYEGEKETALVKTIKMYEKLWPGKFSSIQPWYQKFEKVRVTLEVKQKKADDRFSEFLDQMNKAFTPLGITFGVHEHADKRQFDGDHTIWYNVETAKELQNQLRHMGALPVIFQEAPTVLNARSFIKDANDELVFSLERKSELIPELFQSVLGFVGNLPRHKVIKTITPPAPKAPKPPKTVASGVSTPRPKGSHSGGNPQNLPFMPSSVIGTAFQMCMKGTTETELRQMCTDKAANVERVLKSMKQEAYRGLNWKFNIENGTTWKIEYPLP